VNRVREFLLSFLPLLSSACLLFPGFSFTATLGGLGEGGGLRAVSSMSSPPAGFGHREFGLHTARIEQQPTIESLGMEP
jgi:hypothetical protein